MKKHYKTFGLEDGASQEEIQTAYERLSKELDPKNNDNQEFFVEEYQKVQDAYEALNNSSILATEKGAKNRNSKPKEENSLKDDPANTKPPKSHTNKTKVIGFVLAVLAGIILTTIYLTPKNFKKNQIVDVDGIAYEKHTMVLFTGKIKDSLYEGRFKNGLREGTHYSTSQDLLFITNFTNGHNDGKCGMYFQKKSGMPINKTSKKTPWTEGTYVNGEREGRSRHWNRSGQITTDEFYINGKQDGLWRSWYNNGQLDAYGKYKNGVKVGVWRYWEENGEEKQSEDYN